MSASRQSLSRAALGAVAASLLLAAGAAARDQNGWVAGEEAVAPAVGPADGPGVTAIDFVISEFDIYGGGVRRSESYAEGGVISASSNRPHWPLMIDVEVTMEPGAFAFSYPVELTLMTNGQEVFRDTRTIYDPTGLERVHVPFLVDFMACGSHELRATWLGDASRASRVRRFTGACGE